MMKIRILIQKLIKLQMVSNARCTQVVLRHEQGGLMILSDSVFILACRSEFSPMARYSLLAVLGWIVVVAYWLMPIVCFYYSSMSLLVWLEYAMREHMIYIFPIIEQNFFPDTSFDRILWIWKLQSCVAEIDCFFFIKENQTTLLMKLCYWCLYPHYSWTFYLDYLVFEI